MRIAIAVLLLLAAAPLVEAAEYDVVKLADGVHGIVWKEASPDPNVLIVINDEDVVVVDSSMFPSTSRAIAGEIKKLTPKPVRFVVNTHWHDDHMFGNFVYRELWPGVSFIGHPLTRTDSAKQGFAKIPKDLEDNLKTLELYRNVLKTGKRTNGEPLDDGRRKRVIELIATLEKYDAETRTVKTLLPDMLVDDDLILQRGSRTIEIRHLGRGNTRGDLVVWLPNEKIVATGDLVVYPTPYALGSYYAEWIDTLERVTRLEPKTLFLAHGKPQTDVTYVRKLQKLLGDLVARVGAEVQRGATLEETQKRVTMADWKKEFAGDDEQRQQTFDAFFVTPAVERAWRQAKGEPDNQDVEVR
jgi:cyclase